MKPGTIATHLETRGPFGSVTACGTWSQRMTGDPELVTCGDCKATLDYAMSAGGTSS